MRKNLLDLMEIVQEVTANVPASHGWPHLRKTAEIAYYISSRLGIDPFLPAASALVHDLRWWDEGDRKVRKITIDESWKAAISTKEVLRRAGIDPEFRELILRAVANHQSSAPGLLEQIVSDADRASRMGYEGLLSLLYANHDYGEPFYNEGSPIVWDCSMSLVLFEEIKSCVDDVRACQSWWIMQKTTPGKILFRVTAWVNYQFLQLFQEERGSYETWIPRLEKILQDQREAREDLFQSLLTKEESNPYEEAVLNLESPHFFYEKI